MINFSGHHSDFESFLEKWESRGVKKKYSLYMKPEKHKDLPDTGMETDWEKLAKDVKKKQKKALKAHNYCILDLREACVSNFFINTWIDESKGTTEVDRDRYPYGRVWIVLKRMLEHYRGNSIFDFARFDIDKKLIKMMENENPYKIFERMYRVKKRYAHRQDLGITEMTWVTCIVNGATDMYADAFKTCVSRHSQDNPKVIIEELYKLANALYTINTKNKVTVSDLVTSDKVGLFAAENHQAAKDKWTKGQECYLCGTKGHKAYNCPKKDGKNIGGNGGGNRGSNSGKQDISKIKCFVCKQKGHKAFDCLEKAKNAHRRPQGWVSCLKGEKRNTGKVKGKGSKKDVLYEIVCKAIERPAEERSFTSLNGVFPDNFDLLYDPNIFICSTGASIHCISSNVGVVNQRMVDQVIVGIGGQVAMGNSIGDLPYMKIDKNGRPEFKILLSDVAIGPNNSINIFSATKVMQQGWMLQGNEKKGLSLSRGDKTIKFDIPISTKSGCIWAGYFRRYLPEGRDIGAVSITDKPMSTR